MKSLYHFIFMPLIIASLSLSIYDVLVGTKFTFYDLMVTIISSMGLMAGISSIVNDYNKIQKVKSVE